jgi:hypothetical protein
MRIFLPSLNGSAGISPGTLPMPQWVERRPYSTGIALSAESSLVLGSGAASEFDLWHFASEFRQSGARVIAVGTYF